MSKYSIAAEKLQAVRIAQKNWPTTAICDILELLIENLDRVERCGCAVNYPKGSCPACECPTCHRKKE